jgi:hypothetical protein
MKEHQEYLDHALLQTIEIDLIGTPRFYNIGLDVLHSFRVIVGLGEGPL